MESGKLVFAQLMDFVPRHDFDACVRRILTPAFSRLARDAHNVATLAEDLIGELHTHDRVHSAMKSSVATEPALRSGRSPANWDWSRNTVSRVLAQIEARRAGGPDGSPSRTRPSRLDPYEPAIRNCWADIPI